MAGGESRLGMRVMYMIGLNHGLAQKSTTILHAYKLAENPRKPAQSRAFAHKDPRKFSLNGGEGRDDPFGVRTQRFGVVERAAGGLQRYARPARQQMEVQVKHQLPARDVIELL